jgi:chromosome segregation protein
VRLTQIKLAGFKSFVDPTTIATPGQLVGVVGPNGCGKSNVIDAVRWVLGESKASALRGESMQDVIFNGAGDRKPVSRASVELIFDNSLGRASGQWSQYAELSIKRVLQRDGDSAYYINNIAVRRRDITDLFLGTGLGPRAYAIIEQGMISRIIEAKPEELRVFLEEAAGVSKYRERRKETESRLSSTRENLSRVEDIRGELDAQLTKLEAQAKVATEYRELDARLGQAQRLLWFARQQEAARARERYSTELARLLTAFEGMQAELRATETRLESLRGEHFAAGDALHGAQGLFYEANAEVSRLEQQLQFQRENEERIARQLAQLASHLTTLEQQRETAAREISDGEQALESALARREATTEAERTASTALPALESAVREGSQRVGEEQRKLADLDQTLQVVAANRAHSEKLRVQLGQRRGRLEEEGKALPPPNEDAIREVQERWEQESGELDSRQRAMAMLQDELAELQANFETHRTEERQAVRELGEHEARAQALAALQAKLQRSQESGEWLRSKGLSEAPRFWQSIGIAAGWEEALEAVLREALNAVRVESVDDAAAWQEPPGRLAAFVPGGEAPAPDDARLLAGRITVREPALQQSVNDWLTGVYCADDLASALAARHELRPGERWVTPQGHIVSRHAVAFFAPDQSIHGVLARQRELSELERTLETLRLKAQEAQRRFAATEAALKQKQADYQLEVAAVSSQQRRCHDLEVDLIRLKQAAEAAHRRREQIRIELAELNQQDATELEQLRTAEAKQVQLQDDRRSIGQALERARHARNECEVALVRGREALRNAERSAQEARFAERSSRDRLDEIRRRRDSLLQQAEQLTVEEAHLASERGGERVADIEAALQEQLAVRTAREQALAGARDALEAATAALQASEEARFKLEQQLDPARGKIEDMRLKEQAASLQEQQFAEQLQAANADLVGLPEQLQAWGRASTLPGEIERLQQAIAALGAVNLAALDELQAAQERKSYLDKQAADLTEAIETLENAIRRIDRETRALLQETFDAVNSHFGRLFPQLFGGGQAKLLLTGEEILDAGIQVVAQPPGKRNASIHLLSGGEKALTALSLVFAIFMLNPAPFCMLDEVDAPLDDTNTDRFCAMVKQMSEHTANGGTQFIFISHNKITMEMANQLIGVTMAEAGVSRVVAVDIAEALQLAQAA